MDTCKAWSFFNLSLKSFVKKSDNCNNIILFMTAGDSDWKYQYKGLDAITSASIIGDEEWIIAKLTASIDDLIIARNQ